MGSRPRCRLRRIISSGGDIERRDSTPLRSTVPRRRHELLEPPGAALSTLRRHLIVLDGSASILRDSQTDLVVRWRLSVFSVFRCVAGDLFSSSPRAPRHRPLARRFDPRAEEPAPRQASAARAPPSSRREVDPRLGVALASRSALRVSVGRPPTRTGRRPSRGERASPRKIGVTHLRRRRRPPTSPQPKIASKAARFGVGARLPRLRLGLAPGSFVADRRRRRRRRRRCRRRCAPLCRCLRRVWPRRGARSWYRDGERPSRRPP